MDYSSREKSALFLYFIASCRVFFISIPLLRQNAVFYVRPIGPHIEESYDQHWPHKILTYGPARSDVFPDVSYRHPSLREALRQLGYHYTYHYSSYSLENPRDCEIWIDAFEAKFEGCGTFRKEKWDQLLGYCMAITDSIEHNENMRKAVGTENLPEFDAKHGWELLCKFLNKPVSAAPFPRMHDADSFNDKWAPFIAMLDGIVFQKLRFVLLPLTIGALASCLAFLLMAAKA